MHTRTVLRHLAVPALIACTLPAPSAAAQPQAPAAGRSAIEEVLVTARRREESIQATPVTVAAFSAESLADKGVRSTQDLMHLVPGVVLSAAGSNTNTTFTIRGQGRDVIGPGQPSVISYINEVPMPARGSVLPAFDVANMQVLKGPQGTLFGRNTTGGAVLVYTREPGYAFEGYVQGTGGEYGWGDIQGGFSVPLIDRMLAVRVAGQYTHRDGYTEVLDSANRKIGEQDEIDTRSVRVSVLFEPTDFIRNVLVYDRADWDNGTAGIVPTGRLTVPNPAYRDFTAAFGPAFGGLLTPLFFCPSGDVSCNIDAKLQRQIQAGPRKVWSDKPESHEEGVSEGVSNTTTIQFGEITFKNIFGWRRGNVFVPNNTDGIDAAILDVDSYFTDKQFTNEIQVRGRLFNDKLDWLLGYFVLRREPDDASALKFEFYRPPFLTRDQWSAATFDALANVQNAMYKEASNAVFASGTVDLGDWLPGLKATGGVRFTRDKNEGCGNSYGPYSADPYMSWDACLNAAPDTHVVVSQKRVTWQAGLEYQYTEDIFLYATGRTGYRAGGVNTPRFFNPLTNLPSVFAPFQTYEPHDATDVEVGIKTRWVFGGWEGTFNIDYFHTDYENFQRAITGIPQGIDGDGYGLNDPSNTTLVLNGANAVIQGVDVEVSAMPFDGLWLSAAANYTDAKKTDLTVYPFIAGIAGVDNTSVDNTPESSFTLAARYRLPWGTDYGEFHLSGDYYWVDEYFVGQSRVPGYSLLNFTLDWKNMFGQPLSAALFVNNATDEIYQLNSTLSATQPGYETYGYGPPRMVGVRLRYEFGQD
ncbi:MAG: TonB-dependent receptor [Gammaproteobacteria bacterium]